MRDLSLFLIKNSLGDKMKKGLRSFCNDDGSTSTLNQHHNTTCTPAAALAADTSSNPAPLPVRSPTTNYNYYLQQNNTNSIYDSDHDHHQKSPPRTLEEMILRLHLEGEMARSSKYSKPKDYNKYNYYRGRMSCVNNSDILRSAWNALNEYLRSLSMARMPCIAPPSETAWIMILSMIIQMHLQGQNCSTVGCQDCSMGEGQMVQTRSGSQVDGARGHASTCDE